MSDLPPESRPAPPPEPDPSHTRVLPPDREPPPPKPPLSERVWSFRSVIAVALASVIVGGLGGALLANVGDDDERFRPGEGRFGPGGPMRGPGMMDDRRRERWDEWRRDQRRRDRGYPPGLPPTAQPSARPSSPATTQPSSPSPTPTR